MTARTDPKSVIRAASDRLEGTRAVDAQGRLLVLRHATNRAFDAFSQTTDIGFHFGSMAQAAKRRDIMVRRGEAAADDPWRVVTCALAVRNPLVVSADPGAWNPRWLTATLCGHLDEGDRDAIRILERRLSDGPDDEIDAVVEEWCGVLRAALLRSGYDGIVYRNVFESAGRAMEWSWVAFDDAQVVRLPDGVAGDFLPSDGVDAGASLKLRAVGPLREHLARGTGRLTRPAEVRAFRSAVEAWAEDAGIGWERTYPLDYEPSFGEARPQYDLSARVGGDDGFFVRVSSRTGEVLLQPFSTDEGCDALMKRFRSDASEMFFEHGSEGMDGYETVTWRPAETLAAFAERLEAVGRGFAGEFAPAAAPAPR